MTQIKDGTGGGYLARVDSKNRLRGYNVVEEEATYINRVEGEMYSGLWGGSITAATAGNFVCYLKNTHPSKDLIITKFKHRCTGGNGTLSIWINVIGTPGGTLTELTPGNRNAGVNNIANCEYYKSTNITGLSGGRQVGSIYGKDGEEFEFFQPCSGIILPINSTLALKCDSSTVAHYAGFAFYFRNK